MSVTCFSVWNTWFWKRITGVRRYTVNRVDVQESALVFSDEAPAASEKRLTAGVSSTPSAPAAPSFKKSSWVFSVWRWV